LLDEVEAVMGAVESENRAFFTSHREDLHVSYSEEPGWGEIQRLREAQAGAFWSVRSHFTINASPAMVVLPTGSGKTALMTILAYGIARERVLVIAPSRVIREQIAREFETLRVARSTKSLPADIPTPHVKVVNHKLKSAQDWESLRQYHVCVSTARCISPGEPGVWKSPPKDLFDTVFIDEGHHLAAPTWEQILEMFASARVVSFTATPFRNDKKPLPGELVYAYPVSRAIEKGIYRPIEFVPVDGSGSREEKDRRLAHEARRIWEHESQARKAKILVRVGRIAETKSIRTLYRQEGLNLKIVTSDKSLKQNETAIANALTNDNCHGLISVGMLGEGLDLPVLRIAVMHQPHQSFPVTLQFIGRICRVSSPAQGTSKLLAIPEDVQEHTRDLYEFDANWTDLIPKLAEAAIGHERDRRSFVRDTWKISTREKEVSIHTLRPACAVCVYSAAKAHVDLAAPVVFDQETNLFQSYESQDGRWRVLITRTAEKPMWSTSDSIHNMMFDLHIYYLVSDLLFEATTAPGIAREIRGNLGEGPLTLFPQERIEQVVAQSTPEAYFNVGLRKVAYTTASIPSYKMLAGSHAEEAIRDSDGSFFTMGHVFSKVTWNDREEILGFSTARAKIWSAARSHILEFTGWCDRLAQILLNKTTLALPFLEHLKQAVQIDTISATPYAVDFNPEFYEKQIERISFELQKDGETIQTVEGDSVGDLQIVEGGWDGKKPHECHLQICLSEQWLPLSLNYQSPELFTLSPNTLADSVSVKVMEKGRTQPYTLSKYLEDFPPVLYLTDGSAIIGRCQYPYASSSNHIPDALYTPVDWNSLNCEITVEDINMVQDEEYHDELIQAGKCSVIEATGQWLLQHLREDTMLLCDHHSGEIADYVAVYQKDGFLWIDLYHCKASRENVPGVRQQDAYEVLGQARKCLRWFNRDFFMEIMKSKEHRKVIRGSIDDFKRIVGEMTPQLARKRVTIIQPGFAMNKIRRSKDESIRLMLLSTYEELKNLTVDFQILCS
jgi:superfamily II DNA or RNA helicase